MSDTNKSSTGTPQPPSERGKFPARLHVVIARAAKVGLVIRRGPSKSVCTVLWNRKRDGWVMSEKEYQDATLFEKEAPEVVAAEAGVR